jgi:hypothetical protein
MSIGSVDDNKLLGKDISLSTSKYSMVCDGNEPENKFSPQ